MQNYHKHTSYSNIMTPDSAASYEDYAKRAVELGHKVISSVEHGWQGYYYECYELAQKYNLKFIFGAEAYWVKDRKKEYAEIDIKTGNPKLNKDGSIKTSKDKTNGHIILLAKNENGRRAINRILSTANEDGYYFKPRVDLELLLSLPSNDVMITTACVAYWQYEDIDNITLQLFRHFGKNFYLEIQYHDTENQKLISKRTLELSQKYHIPMIVGLDSHYVYPEQADERQYILEAKHVHYADEDGWYMDYPDDETVMQRFLQQGVFNREQIQQAMNNTDVVLSFEDYAINNPVFSKDIKLPTLYPELSQEERNKKYSILISRLFKDYVKENNITGDEYKRYFDGVKMEVQTVKDTGMADYFLLDYEIVKKAISMGGVLTDTGRGSSVGYFTNTLLGFSKVDRFKSPITLYPERFISKTRILETHSLPDIDMNWGTPEIAEEAQKQILGADHAIPMIAFGTCKKKSAFKLYARSQNMDFELANTISSQIDKYEEAIKYASDEDKDDISVYDYVDEQYKEYIDKSQKYWGIIMDKKKAPCAFLLYSGNIREEIGLIKCKSESSGKEFITAVIDGAIAENYKFLKNDILTVSVVLLIDKIYKAIGIKHHTVDELRSLVKDDPLTWNIYANGWTLGVNQCEQASSIKKMMKFKAKNVSELSAWIAAIRPAFKSMYSKFEGREHFEYGIHAFDKLLQTEEMPQSFILYQEQTMSVLNYAGFPLDECYGIIKAIAKKHPEKVKPLKSRFLDGFKNKIIQAENVPDDKAAEMSVQVWEIIENSCGYGFNSAHAYCMALDSLYCSYLKAHYPYEFYETLLQFHSDRGEKDKVAALKQEMRIAFGIREGAYKFGNDNRRFVADKDYKIIQPSLLSLKGFSQECADDLYQLSQSKTFDNFIDLLNALSSISSMNKTRLDILVKIDYFSCFGRAQRLLKIIDLYNMFHGKKQIKKDKITLPIKILSKYALSETDKMFKFDDEHMNAMLSELCAMIPDTDIPFSTKLQTQQEMCGYISYIDPTRINTAVVMSLDTKYSPKVTCYDIATGDTFTAKIKKKLYQMVPFGVGDILKYCIEKNKKWKKENDDWVQIDEYENWLSQYTIETDV